ncbi:MAG: NMD3-related protein [Candidatus Diapherotrites archaeon]|nr:NMD3-related protein [Candidatus Diapherotrites archaeon]
MSFERFCAKCGKATEDLVGGLCSNCYLKKHSLFEVKDFNIERCVKCGKLRIKGRWGSYNNELINGEVLAKIKLGPDLLQPKIFVELIPMTKIDFSAKIKVMGFVNEVLLEQTKSTEFSINKVSCDSCMKLVSNYREAIIQLRAPSKSETSAMLEVTKNLFFLEQSKDSLAAIVKTFQGKAGIDLWIGSRKGANRVVRKLEKLYKTNAVISKKLIGVADGGAEKFRVTYCIKSGASK